MKYLPIILASIVLGVGCATPQHSLRNKNPNIAIAKDVVPVDLYALAILPFAIERTESVDHVVADQMAVHFMQMGFNVIERSQLEAIFQEAKLSMSGVVNPEQLQYIGHLSSVGLLGFGTISYKDWEKTKIESISLRIVSVSSGQIRLSAIVHSPPSKRKGIDLLSQKINEAIQNEWYIQ